MEMYLEEYFKEFGEAFPMIPIAWGRTEEEIVQIIKRCIKEQKDVYELGYVTESEDVMY